MSRILLDTGPLVAIYSRNQVEHEACVEQLRDLDSPLLTCWPVITEAAWLMRRFPSGLQHLLRDIESGIFHPLSLEPDAVPWIAAFLRRYRDLPADLADAALMYLAERENIDTIFTLDRRDFSVYRLRGNRSARLLPRA